jgi:hypothetical protein
MSIFFMLLWRVFAREKTRIAERDLRPPEMKLLRPPGHWLQERLVALADETGSVTLTIGTAATLAVVLIYPVVIAAASVMAAPEAFSHPRALRPLLFGCLFTAGAVLCGLWACKSVRRLRALKKEIHARRLGLRGEQAVAEALHSPEVAGRGYFSFHDVPCDGGGNIDHVVLGPGGVFIIESKMRSQEKVPPGQKRNRLSFDGQTTSFPSGGYDHNASKQARRNAAVLQGWLAPGAPEVTVEALLVFPGWEVHMTERCDDVKALSSNQLRNYFNGLQSRVSSEQLNEIRLILDRRCRTVLI